MTTRRLSNGSHFLRPPSIRGAFKTFHGLAWPIAPLGGNGWKLHAM